MPVTPKAPSGVLASVIATPSELPRHLREQGRASAAEIAQIEREPVGDDLARMAAQVEKVNNTAKPAHYDKPVDPWALIECMESSGNAFVDFLRGEAIKHIWRDKGDLREGLQKAASEINKAISLLP